MRAPAGIAPHDDSYKNPGYFRGHLCMREHARRLGQDADFNTHTVVNACPQLQAFNAGAWLRLEKMCSKWADSVWIICGPIVEDNVPTEWIGDGDEVRGASRLWITDRSPGVSATRTSLCHRAGHTRAIPVSSCRASPSSVMG